MSLENFSIILIYNVFSNQEVTIAVVESSCCMRKKKTFAYSGLSTNKGGKFIKEKWRENKGCC
jgi:hypothetical protein